MNLPFILTILVFLCAAMAVYSVFYWFRHREVKEYASALEDTLRIGGAGLLIFDKSDSLKHTNPVAEQYLEQLRDRNVVLNLDDFIAYTFDNAIDGDLDVPEHFGGSSDFREIIMVDDGRSYLVEMYKLQKGRTTALIRDVSKFRAQNEDLSALNIANERLNLAIESTSCGVFIVNAKANAMPVLFLNRMCRNIASLNYSILPESFLDLFRSFGHSTQDADILFESIQEHQRQGSYEGFQEQVVFGEGDMQRWFDFRLTPIFDHNEELDLYVGVLSEITALKIKEEEVSRAQKLEALGQLSAGIAHDFNNILSIVEGYARMIEMNSHDIEKILEYSKKIKKSSTRGAELTKKMMAFARHKVKQDNITDLKALLSEQQVLLKSLIDERIDFNILCDDGDLYAHCEANAFVQILMNLVINARDAMEGIGDLKVYLELVSPSSLPKFVKDRKHDYLCLRVCDSGSGMSKDVTERIFDPFFTTKEQGKGTGLGLSVVYGLVRDMNGYIDVRSELSVGTEFSVFIPRAEQLPEPAKSLVGSADDIETIKFDGYTALIAEDESDLREILATFLKRHGMEVLEAENGNDALVLQDDYEDDIDFLITDLVMPGMTGLKLADMFKAVRPDAEIVFMSGYPARGENAKVDIPEDAFFISKPIDFDGLCLSLFEMLSDNASNVVPINSKKIGEMS